MFNSMSITTVQAVRRQRYRSPLPASRGSKPAAATAGPLRCCGVPAVARG